MIPYTAAFRACAVLAPIALAGTIVLPQPAEAHPHVWIYATSDVVMSEDGRVTAIDIVWEFDEFYSLTAAEGMDADGNGSYEASELQPLAAENIAALEDFSYFTEISVGGETVKPGKVTEFQSTFKEGRMSLVFRIPLTEPLDPKAAEITYRMYDPSFFIAIEYQAKNPVATIGELPEGCEVKVIAADGDPDELPQSEQDFLDMLQNQGIGGMYAETAAIDCKGKPAS